MAGLSKAEQAKKGPKKQSLHTEPIHELPKAVDWDEQERIKASLKGKFIQPFRSDGRIIRTGYTPEKGAELCILRRSGMSARQITEKTGIAYDTVKRWIADFPEFSQEWGDAYADYITDTAEELVPLAEKLMQGLRMNGKKLSSKQEGRYLRAAEYLANQVRWAAAKRVPALYGDAEGGMELVLVQPVNIPTRDLTQDIPRAEAWKEELKEAEDAESSVSGPDESDGVGGDVLGTDNSGGVEQGDSGKQRKKPVSKRRYKSGGRSILERPKPIPDVSEGPGGV